MTRIEIRTLIQMRIPKTFLTCIGGLPFSVVGQRPSISNDQVSKPSCNGVDQIREQRRSRICASVSGNRGRSASGRVSGKQRSLYHANFSALQYTAVADRVLLCCRNCVRSELKLPR